jgi:hypothetical protein
MFIGGSLGISVLPALAVERIDAAISEDAEFLVGDAPGVDALVQKYLHKRGVRSVRVFHSTPQRRLNLGHWPEQFVDSGLKSTSSAMHGAKDREMARQCDQALMVWDTKSVGTITNVLDVTGRGKPWRIVVTAPGEDPFEQDSFPQLVEEFPTVVEDAQKRLRSAQRRDQKARLVREQAYSTLPI